MGEVSQIFGATSVLEEGILGETGLALIQETLQASGVEDEALFDAIEAHDLLKIARLLRDPSRKRYWAEIQFRSGRLFAPKERVFKEVRAALAPPPFSSLAVSSSGLQTVASTPASRSRGLPKGNRRESIWLTLYQRFPPRIRGRILDGEDKGILLKDGELDIPLKKLNLTGSDLALVLCFSEMMIFQYRHGGFRMPKRVYEVLEQAASREEALQRLLDFIAQATQLYTTQFPFYEQFLEMHRLLGARKISLERLINNDARQKLKGKKDISPVLEILKQDIPLDEMKRRILETLRMARRRIAFYREEPSNRILREAPQKFGVSKKEMARMLGIKLSYYYSLAAGTKPVPRSLAPRIQIIQEASTLKELTERFLTLPSQQIDKTASEAAAVSVEPYVKKYRARVLGIAFRVLERYDLATEANANDIAQDVFIALDRSLKRPGGFHSEKQLQPWFWRVVRTKVFDFVLASRGISKDRANFYLRMRELIRGHPKSNGGDFDLEDLMAFDPHLSREDAAEHLRRYRELCRLFVGIEQSIEDLPKFLRNKL